MKVAVIFTGGTIGSAVKNGVADVNPSAKQRLLRPFLSDPELEFFSFFPYSILSENLSAFELNLLQKEIQSCLEKEFDGILVTHGTDTLHYAAAAADLAFGDAPVPIVFVSADLPLENPRSNGFANLKAALEWIKAKKAGGVFVSFRNAGEKITNLHLPSRLLQYQEGKGDLSVIDRVPFATYEKECSVLLASPREQKSIGVVEYCPDSGILCISSRPGDDFCYSLDGVKAVLFSPYHSGTLPTANPAFRAFCLKAKKAGIPAFLAPFSPEVVYQSTAPYQELGIKPLRSPFSYTYMKIWAAVSSGEPIAERFQEKTE